MHAVLYLKAEPMPAQAIGETLALDAETSVSALDWLEAQGLVEPTAKGWRTGIDPWVLMTQTLEKRRELELSEARKVIDSWRRARTGENPLVSRQAERLFQLVDDIAAIDAGTRGISPATTRRLIGLGARAARLLAKTVRERGRQ